MKREMAGAATGTLIISGAVLDAQLKVDATLPQRHFSLCSEVRGFAGKLFRSLAARTLPICSSTKRMYM